MHIIVAIKYKIRSHWYIGVSCLLEQKCCPLRISHIEGHVVVNL